MAILIEPPQNELSALQNLSDSAGFLKKMGDGNYLIDNNNYLPLSGGNLTGELSIQHTSPQSGATWTSVFSAFGIDLGQSATDPLEYSFVDFHSYGALVDFDARIQCTGGYGGENRGGSLEFLAKDFLFVAGDVYNPKSMTIDANGNVSVDGTLSGKGSGLTSLNASNISTGTLNAARLPDTYLPLAGGTVTGVTNFSSVGIGTATPDTRLHISHTSTENLSANPNWPSGTLKLEDNSAFDSGMGPSIIFYKKRDANGNRSVAAGITAIGVASSEKLQFYVGSANNLGLPKMTIQVDGNVGIGTIPSAKLDVNGSAKATSFFVGNNQIISSRKTGWVAPTGTATRSTFSTSTVTLVQLAERVKGLIDDLVAHGLIGA